MVGQFRADLRTGLYYYIEAIYDKAKNGALIVKTVAECGPIGNVASITAPTPPTVAPHWGNPQGDVTTNLPTAIPQPTRESRTAGSWVWPDPCSDGQRRRNVRRPRNNQQPDNAQVFGR